MTIKIYRKRSIPFGTVTDDNPETTFCGVSDIVITDKRIFGIIDGEQLIIECDHWNYAYTVK